MAKGKRKLTVEVRPETLDAIDERVRARFGTRGKGAVLDELTAGTLLLEPGVAEDLHRHCVQEELRLLEAGADPSSPQVCSYRRLAALMASVVEAGRVRG